jgi:hypothetical protein
MRCYTTTMFKDAKKGLIITTIIFVISYILLVLSVKS